MIFFALIPVLRGMPQVPEGWVLRREGGTGYFSLYAGVRSPENRIVLEVLGETRGMFLTKVNVSDGALRAARPMLEQIPAYFTLAELRDPTTGPDDEEWRTLAAEVAEAFPDQRARDEHGELLDPLEPKLAVRSSVAGVDVEGAVSRASRERVVTPTLPPDLEEGV